MTRVSAELHPDEPAMWLREFDRHTPNFGMRRIQEICVVRPEDYEFTEADLGPSEQFPALGFHFICGVEENGRPLSKRSVGEAMEWAAEFRMKPPTERTLAFLSEESGQVFLDDVNIALDESQKRLENISSFGSLITVQRNTEDRHIRGI